MTSKQLLVCLALGIVSSGGVSAFAQSSFRVDVHATYLTTSQDPNATIATPIDLNVLNVKAGDKISLEPAGTLSFCITGGCPQVSPSLLGLFSATASSTGALATSDGTPIVTSPTLFDQLPTDIPQDFFISAAPSVTVVTVPQGAKFLFVIVADVFYSDNEGSLSVLIANASPLVITTADLLPDGTKGTAYGPVSLTATGGIPPYTWTVTGLPPVLGVNANNAIAGTPTESNFTFPFKIGQQPPTGIPFPLVLQVADSTGHSKNKTALLSINDLPLKRYKTDAEANALLAESIKYSGMAAAFYIIAASPECAATLVCTVAMTAQAEGYTELAIKTYLAALDPPDGNFHSIRQPKRFDLPFIAVQPGLSQGVANALNALNQNLSSQIGLLEALTIAINRAQGAAEAGNSVWENRQLQAAAEFAQQLAVAKTSEPQLRQTLSQALSGSAMNSVEVTAAQIIAFQQQLKASGFAPVLSGTTFDTEDDDDGNLSHADSALFAIVGSTFDMQDAAGVYPLQIASTTVNAAEAVSADALREFAARFR